MSIEAMAWALDAPVSGTDKVVLIGIASHADRHGGNAWPSLDTLAGYANVTRRATQNSVAKLVALGLVSVELNAGGTRDTPSDRRPNLYRCHLDGVTSTSPRGVKPSAPRGEAGRADGVKPTSPEPSLNRPEPSSEGARLFDAGEHVTDATRAEQFEEFWTRYPRKVAKPTARRAFLAALTRRGYPGIRDGLERWRGYWSASSTPADKIPHPSTWLNGDRWDDEPPTVLPQRQGRATMRVDTDRSGETRVMRGSDW